MLTSFILTLTPRQNVSFLINTGRLVHGAFLDFIRVHDTNLSDDLHNPQTDKPYTVSSLTGEFQKGSEKGIVAVVGTEYQLRITTIRQDLSELVLEKLN